VEIEEGGSPSADSSPPSADSSPSSADSSPPSAVTDLSPSAPHPLERSELLEVDASGIVGRTQDKRLEYPGKCLEHGSKCLEYRGKRLEYAGIKRLEYGGIKCLEYRGNLVSVWNTDIR
jgi:hypothetical protein